MRRFAPPVPSRSSIFVCLLLLLGWISTPAAQQSARPIADPNVNMVRGFTKDDGDPYLQRQNEPSIAVSTRNPCHLLAGANDYRSVDIPDDDLPIPPNGESNISLAGDAWLGVFKSFDCGAKWASSLLPGYPQDKSGKALQLKGYEAGADPTVRAAHNGLFYYSGMVFNRGTQGDSKIFVARFVDNNNKERGDPIELVEVTTVDSGAKGQFLDKPWLAVDVPRSSFGPGSSLATSAGNASSTCTVNGQQVAAGNVYMAWARFTGDGTNHSKLMFARSADCGQSWLSHPMSNNQSLSQGANIAIAPHDGTIYLTWREFAGAPGAPVNMWLVVSSDGGKTFTSPKMIAPGVKTFDQIKSGTKFRSNALPAITADHQNRVYVAWSETGYGWHYENGVKVPNNDARIVMTVSSDRGLTFSPAFPIDPNLAQAADDNRFRRGHQMMPSLTFAAGKIQAVYYDAREDVSKIFEDFIDDKHVGPGKLRHSLDVRGAQADPSPLPVFVPAGLDSLEISKYRQWVVDIKENGQVVRQQSIEIGANPPNLPMYAKGTMPFMGDYIDVSGLPSYPVQTSNGQMWQPNIGPINLMGGTVSSIMSTAYPTLPIFHAAWTDNRDVRAVASAQCTPDPSQTGERNANIYTSRLTPGLFVGSPGNTKPLGFRPDPQTGQPTTELIQRGFVVFAQNTLPKDLLDSKKNVDFYEFHITNQPVGGKATFRQFEKADQPRLDKIVVAIPRGSTVARTVYATSTDINAQILVNVQQVTPIEIPGTAALGTPGPDPKKEYDWPALPGGLRASILLNPDRTNPKILEPDLDSEVPDIAATEVHNPSMFDAQFFRHKPGSSSRQLDVKNPDPESPDPESPDPESDPENPDPESPDPESSAKNPDPESPDPESPDPESPDPESPDPESAGVLNTAIGEDDARNSTITDINWRVHNAGNTTSAYRFKPVLQETGAKTKYQLIVTRRYMTLAMDPETCKPVYKSQNQVLVSIVNFDPKAPDPESPDPESPDPESPDPESPDPESPDPESPDPESPDPESASFFLSPDETATVTLRAFTPPDEDPPTSETKGIAAKASAQKANTGETKVSSAVAGPDLTLLDEPFVAPSTGRAGQTINVTWTLTNRGTADAVSPSGTIKTNVYFSNDGVLSTDDVRIQTVLEPSPFAFCAPNIPPAEACFTTTTTPVTLPATPGQYFVLVVTDDDNDADDPDDEGPDPDREVFEADELNNALAIPVRVDAYQLAFGQQPSATTQDFSMTPAVTVAVTHFDGFPVTAKDVPIITLSIANNAGTPPGVLSGSPTAQNIGGVATFSDLRISQPGTGYTFAATAPFSTAAFSAAFNIEADAAPAAGNDSHTVLEDAVLTVAAPGVLTNDSDPATKGLKPQGYGLHAVDRTEPADGGLSLNQDGSFTYTPRGHFNGTNSFTYAARDGRQGNDTPATVTLIVTAVNDPPSFNKGGDQTVAEDAGLQTVPGWATNMSPGAPDENAQALDFIVDNNNTGLFATQPAISPNGTLTYTTAPNRDGVAIVTVRLHDNGLTANGGSDTSAPQTFTISVNGENDGPVSQPDTYTTREDTPLTVDVNQGLLFNDTDPDGNTLVAQYLTTPANGTLLPQQNGSFSYTPHPNFFGTDSFTYRAFDGNTTGNTVTVTLTVQPVNDVPSFSKGDDQVVPMNATTQVFAWATLISTGPANEADQSTTFIVTNDNNALFATQPAISPTGTLSFTPRNTRQGIANVTVRLQDNGGVANGGIDTSATQTFAINITSAVQIYTVTNVNDSGAGSFRTAISNANANASPDVIRFNLSGTGVRTIALLSPLPAIVFPLTINATTQPGYNGVPLVQLNGAGAGLNANGFTVQSDDVTIRGFVINRFSGAGIAITGAGNLVAGNYLGTNAAGTAALPNGQDGVRIAGAANLVGGATATERNVISGNARHGVMVGGSAVDGNAIRGNYIGTNAAGSAALGNSQAGVWVEQAGRVLIGGDGTGEGNVISGNAANGVHLYVCPPTPVPCAGAVVAGNRIGTNAAGTASIGNRRNGIEVTNSPNHVIRGNLISGNGTIGDNLTGDGIAILVPTLAADPQAEVSFGNHTIAGNLIGTNATGNAGLPNRRFGVMLAGATKTRIGGAITAERNVISFNGNAGIAIGHATSPNNTVQGNYIGVNAAGTALAPNGDSGINISNGSAGNLIGGSAATAGNLIGGNVANGISVVDTSSATTIEGNFIGTNAAGTAVLGNNLNGVSLAGSNHAVVRNRIANNALSGIWIASDTGNRLTQNAIYDNGGLGIDLAPLGVSANDPGDVDNSPNNLQNFPIITAAFTSGALTRVAASLNSTPNAEFTIEFFSSAAADPSGNGEGRTFLASLQVTTDNTGNVSFVADVAAAAGQFITATATDTAGNTSEFSNAMAVVANAPPTANNDSATTSEDSVAAIVIPVLANDTDANGDPLSIDSLVQPANGQAFRHPDGTISYTPAPNFFGVDTLTYRVSDGRGGLSAPATVTITVTAVNDAPSFTKGPDQSVNQNAGSQTVPNWATAISAGPLESQAVDFIVTTNESALFAVLPAIAPNGTLTYQPAPGVAGIATVTVRLHDDGNPPGVNTNAADTFLISIAATGTATYLVTNTNDSGSGSLRVAILAANGTPFADVIEFDIPGAGPHTIQPFSTLPTITGRVAIDGTSQPGYDGRPLIRLSGGGNIADGLEVGTDVEGVVIRGLAITGFTNAGVVLLQSEGRSGHIVVENIIGTDRNDTAGIGNGTGIVLRTDNSQIFNNVLSGNTGVGIRIENDADSVNISGNKIGTTFNGLGALPNGTGVRAFGTLNNLVIENNVISSNSGWGIDLQDLPQDHIVNPRIRGNTIGLFANGSTAASNGSGGVRINNARGTLVGEPDVDGQPTKRNVISGNAGPGIHLTGSPVPMPIVQNNYLGTDASGTQAVGNAVGVLVSGNSHALIGGTTVAARNVISGNAGFGVEINTGPTSAATIIQGNFIGLAADGSTALGNASAGIKTTNAAVQVGGTGAGARNIISANPQGVAFSNSGSNFDSFVLGNYFGTDQTGTVARGNSTGVLIGSAPGTTVGGTQAGAGNLFAGNSIGLTVDAISLPRINGNYNSVVQGNTFGLSATGTPLPNGRGIAISNSQNLIGGAGSGAANIIAHNTLTGIYLAPAGTQNEIAANAIHSNGGLGIDLGNDGVTPNDAGDGDAGANNLQNFPVLTTAFTNGIGTTIVGTINTTPSTQVTIELFSSPAADASGYGEGRQFLGTVTLATDASGNASFSTGVGALPVGSFVTATATALSSTSEFSQALVVSATNNNPPTTTADTVTVYSDDSTTTYPATNDTDPDTAAPELLATVRSQPAGSPQFTVLSDLGTVNATGLAYFTGSLGTAAYPSRIGILDTSNGTITSTPIVVPAGANPVKVNQTTQLVYMRAGNNLVAIDGRSASPTFNQVILSRSTAAIQSMVIDETRGRLYYSEITSTAGTVVQSRLVALDVNPATQTFHQVVNELPVPSPASPGTAGSIGVNTTTNRIWSAVSGGPNFGVNVIDGTTFMPVALVASTAGASTLVVNSVNNMVYAVAGSTLLAIDGNTNTVITRIELPALAAGGTDRLAVHTGSGQVFVRLSEFPQGSRLVVVDGNRTSPTFNTIQATLPLGRETGTTVAVDETANRLITTSRADLETTIIDTTTNAVVGTVTATQTMTRISLDTVHHRAYLVGGVGYTQAVDLVSGTQQALIPTGVETNTSTVDLVNHVAYVAQTRLTAGFDRIDHTGLLGSLPTPHGDGRIHHMVSNRVTNRHYVINGAADADGGDEGPGFVTVIDGAINAVVAHVPVGGLPFQGIAVNEATNKIYVGASSFGGTAGAQVFPGGITVIDGVTHATVQADVSQIPRNNAIPGTLSFNREFAVNTATNKVYVRIDGGSPATLGVLDGATNVVTPLPNVFGNINSLRVNPVLNRIYIAGADATGEDQVFVLDGSTHQILATIEAGSPSLQSNIQHHMSINRNTGRVYLADFDDDMLVVIDGTTNTATGIAVGDGPTSVAVNETLNRIYVANFYDRTLMIVDGVTNRVVRSIALPLAPYKLDVDEAVSRIFILASALERGLMVVSDPGGNAPTVTSVTQGAHGTVTLNADGSVTYAPNAGFTGADTYTYTVTDGQGGTTTATVTVNVVSSLRITTASLPATTAGALYAQTVATAGGTGARTVVVASGLLPGGLTLNAATGALSGTVHQSGTFNFTITARDSGDPQQATSRDFSIVVGPPVVTTTFLTSAFVNTPFSQVLAVGGNTGAVTWSLDRLNNPLLSWLSLSPDGTLTGTPPTSGFSFQFSVSATDSLNQVGSRLLSVFVNGPLTVLQPRDGIVLETPPSLSIIGGSGTRTVTVTSGAIPPGLTMNSSGGISGVALRHGSYPFTLEVRDCQPNNGLPSCNNQVTPQTATLNFTWRVSAKEQQGNSATTDPIPFGGLNGRKFAQVVRVGAQGTLTGIGLNNLQCPFGTPLTLEVQRLTLSGLPDDNTIATGTALSNYSAINIVPPVAMAIDERFAFIVSSPVACTMSNLTTTDNYNGGDAYANAGGGWQTLFSTDGRYDLPSFRTLIHPSMDVTYLNRSRSGPMTTTLLTNGRVLITGNNLAAEIYDPVTGTSTLTTGLMVNQRAQHTATLLDDGKVLLVGGNVPNTPFNTKSSTAEIFDPATGLFTAVPGQLAFARDRHRAVRLPDGRVLITGGVNDSGSRIGPAEIYDPPTQEFTSAGNTLTPREQHVMLLLGTGKVLVASGYTDSGPSAELFDPVTGLFTATGNMIVTGRGRGTGTLLADGRVLIAGGQQGDLRAEAELYNPATGTFAATGSLSHKRFSHSATLLSDGTVLIAGGFDQQDQASYIQALASLERYNPVTGTFLPAGSMEAVRNSPGLVTLQNGKALIVGGNTQSWMSGNTAELFDPAAALSIAPTTLPNASPGVAYPPTVLTATGGAGGPYSIAHVSGVLPAGITYTPGTKTIAGTPTPASTGVYQLGFEATDSALNKLTQSFRMNVGVIPTITSPYRLTDGALTANYNVQLTASGAAPFVWSLAPNSSPLPTGLSLSSAGVISGTPSSSPVGTTYFNFTVRAVDTNGTGQTATKVLSIFINQPLAITTTSLADAIASNTYGGCVGRTNGNGNVTWQAAGNMPEGLVLRTDGCFDNAFPARVIKETGTFTFTVTVTDSSSPPQVASREFTITSHAVDQTSFSPTATPIGFGGAGGRRVAQTITVGANGALSGIGLQSITCAPSTLVTIDIQRLTGQGLPDGITIATGSATSNYHVIPVSPRIDMPIDTRFAFVVTASNECTLPNAPITDQYQSGAAFIDQGAGWQSLLASDNRYDLPQFRTLVQPVGQVVYLSSYRHGTNVAQLADGKVLIAGGYGNTSVDLFDPTTDLVTSIGSAPAVQATATTTLLPNGKVLVAGGVDTNNAPLSMAVLFDPASATFTATGTMSVARQEHTATLLGGGRVLIAGGRSASSGQPMTSAEIYDIATGVFTPTGNMTAARNRQAAVRLGDGKVLIVAGQGGSPQHVQTADLYDPSSGTFSATSNMVTPSLDWRTATLLDDGNVLITGGSSAPATTAAEIYNVTTGLFTATGSLLSPRNQHTATKLADGSVLIAGGYAEPGHANYILQLSTLERYLPGSGTFVPAGSMVARRADHDAVPLNDGRVLLIGGYSHSQLTTQAAELYDVTATLSMSPSTIPAGQLNTAYPTIDFTVTGGAGAIGFARTGALPPGMNFDTTVGRLSGTPQAVGRFVFAISAFDTVGRSTTQSYTLNVGAVVITTAYNLANGAVGAPYSVQLSATGSGAIAWSLLTGPNSNSLPPGLSLSSNGVISGTPTARGFYSFSISATDANGMQDVNGFFISINDPLAITTTMLNPGELFSGSGNNCISVNNGTGTRTYSLSGATPPGVTMSGTNNCFQGNYSGLGSFTFNVHVTDQSSPPQTATKQFTISVWAADQSQGQLGSPDLNFGGTSQTRVAQRVITGISGMLRAIRITAPCPIGTNVMAEIQGLTAAGAPDGVTIAAGVATRPFFTIPLDAGVFFAADQPFALIVNADQLCTMGPPTIDNIPGEGYVSQNGGAWQTLQAFNGDFDLVFTSFVEPVDGLLFTAAGRGDATETVLLNGRVLLVGGGNTNTAELISPAAGTVIAVGNMTTSRTGHTATLLPDGRVLVTGGTNGAGTRLASAEIFDPATNAFTATANMGAARGEHTATLLNNGTVLVAGGRAQNGSSINSAEIYDPGTGLFTAVGIMFAGRSEHTATKLNDGRVLLAGGYGAGSGAELYHPGSFTFTRTDNFMSVSRGRHAAALLDNGHVLITGGTGNGGEALASAELFDPDAGPNEMGLFSPAGNMRFKRVDHTATMSSDGSVIIAGGYSDNTCCYPHEPQATIERYDGAFEEAGSMKVSRYRHTASILTDGRIMFAGTWGWSSASARLVEFYDEELTPHLVATNSGRQQSGMPIGFVLQATGGTGTPYSVTHISGRLPNSITYNPATLTFSGASTESGRFQVTMRVTDGSGTQSYQTVTLEFDTVLITTVQTLPTAYQGQPYVGVGLSAQGAGPITWAFLSGSVPPGLTFNPADGSITGSPTVSCCFYSFTVRATDAIGQTAVQTFFISVQAAAPALAIAPISTPMGLAAETYITSLTPLNNTGNVTWTLDSGVLPPGVTIQSFAFSGSITGVPTQPGVYSFTVKATDQSVPPQVATQAVTVRVAAVDQRSFGGSAGPILVNASSSLAQTFTARANAPLRAIRTEISCSSGTLTISIRNVTVTGEPGATVLASATFPSPTGPGIFPLTTTPSFANGDRFAVAFSSNGACEVFSSGVPGNYPGGVLFEDSGSGWSLVPGDDEIGVETVVDLPAVQFMTYSRWSPSVNDGVNDQMVITGNGDKASIYDQTTGTLVTGANGGEFRDLATATRLLSGKILIAGGYASGVTNSAEIYDPALGTYSPTAGGMLHARENHTATLLADGRVFIAGGDLDGVDYVQEAEIYDPATNQFHSAGNMLTVRVFHQATLLPNGNVLITGGGSNAVQTPIYVPAEVFTPSGGTGPGSFAAAGEMVLARMDHRAVRLSDGRVLVTAGQKLDDFELTTNMELYDELCNCFTVLATGLNLARKEHTATLLADGRILVAGGQGDLTGEAPLTSVEIVDPGAGFTAFQVGNLHVARAGHAAMLLCPEGGCDFAGQVLLAGGNYANARDGDSVEIFDPNGISTGGVPAQPSNLVALSPQVGTVVLNWTDNSSSELTFELAQDGSLAVARTVGADITTATFTGLAPGNSYHWYVRACNAQGCSAWLGPVGKTPDGSDP